MGNNYEIQWKKILFAMFSQKFKTHQFNKFLGFQAHLQTAVSLTSINQTSFRSSVAAVATQVRGINSF
jgi:hypothetical protein